MKAKTITILLGLSRFGFHYFRNEQRTTTMASDKLPEQELEVIYGLCYRGEVAPITGIIRTLKDGKELLIVKNCVFTLIHSGSTVVRAEYLRQR